MTGKEGTGTLLRWLPLLAATVLITVAFVDLTRAFLIPLALAAIIGEVIRPQHEKIVVRLGGRRAAASVLTLLALAMMVIGPLMILIAVSVAQAADLLDSMGTLAHRFEEAEKTWVLPAWVPYDGTVEDLWAKVVAKLGAIAQTLAGFFISSVSSVTIGAAAFFLDVFIFLYALFCFLMMKRPVMDHILSFTGLPADMQTRLSERIVSVSRATIKGTLVIGFIQGALGGAALWAAGIDSFAFWSVVMMVLAVIPGLGAPSVLFVASIWLAIEGAYLPAAGLALWAALVVGTVDNVLRPTLVGRDAQLHDIMILVSTLGGLVTLGASGLILGPALAGVFVTVWSTVAEAMAGGAGQPRSDRTTAPTGEVTTNG